jgi:hypothetical protein
LPLIKTKNFVVICNENMTKERRKGVDAESIYEARIRIGNQRMQVLTSVVAIHEVYTFPVVMSMKNRAEKHFTSEQIQSVMAVLMGGLLELPSMNYWQF